jgi:hypothetical protein
MTGYQFAVSCPGCGGSIHHQADGKVTARAVAAVGECANCRAWWRIDVRLSCVREAQQRLGSLEEHPWNEQAPGADLIRLIMAVEDELAGNGSPEAAVLVAQEARRG